MAFLLVLGLPNLSLAAILQRLYIEWSYEDIQAGSAGYKIYQDGSLIATLNDPLLYSTELDVYLETGQANSFTVTAFDTTGLETPPSPPYTIDVPAEDENGNIPPVLTIKLTPSSGEAPLIVDCDATSSFDFDGTIASYSWDFGDGSVASYAATSHTYNIPGTYTVRLTATDNEGGTATTQATVTVAGDADATNAPPVASMYLTTTSGPAPLAVLLDGSSSTDSDGTISSYSWDFGDGYSGTGAFVNHTYASSGTFTAILTVTDNGGKSASAQSVITVTESTPSNQPPTAVITASPLTGQAPFTSSFSGAGSTDADGTITAYAWDFGDGATASGLTVSHQYTTPGAYIATLTVTDNNAASAKTQVNISVEAAATTASSLSDSFGTDTSSSYTKINPNAFITVSGGAAHGSSWQKTMSFHNTVLTASDHWVEADVVYSGKTDSAGILARVDATNKTGYAAYFGAGGILNLARFSGTSQTLLTQFSGGYLAGTYALRMVMAGSSIKVFVNDELKIEKSDATYASGRNAGIYINRISTNIDVTADNFTASTGTPPAEPKANTLPVTQSDTLATQEDTPASGTLKATDAESDTLTFAIVANGSLGTAVLTNTATGAFTYTPKPNVSGADSFSFKANDGTGDSNIATVTISIAAANDPPVAQNASLATPEDTPVNGILTATDPEGAALTYAIVANGSLGTAVLTNAASGAFTYTPKPNANGIDSFSFKASDGDGASNLATISITLQAVNDPPSALADTAETNENIPATIFVLANDSDPDGDQLTVQSVTQGANGSVANNGNSVTYTPKPGWFGNDSFSYTLSDGQGGTATATVQVAVNEVNYAPVAQNLTATTMENTPIGGQVLATDADGDPLTYSIVSNGSLGVAVITNPATGAFTYTPAPDAFGTDSFTYKTNDGKADSNLATVTVTIANAGVRALSDDFAIDTSANYTKITPNAAMTVSNGAAHGQQWNKTFSYQNTILETSDHWVEATVTYNGKADSAGVLARVDRNNNTGYAAYFGGGKLYLYRFVGGNSQTLVSQQNGKYPAGTYRVRLEATGSTFRVFVNGVLKIEKADATYTFGRNIGLAFYRISTNTDVTADDFKGGI